MRELRISDKNEITELAVQTLSRTCPYIVDFYGCLVREVMAASDWLNLHQIIRVNCGCAWS